MLHLKRSLYNNSLSQFIDFSFNNARGLYNSDFCVMNTSNELELLRTKNTILYFKEILGDVRIRSSLSETFHISLILYFCKC